MRLGRILLYARDVEETVSFYEKHFGFKAFRQEGDRIVELVGDEGACIMVHQAAKGQKGGQSTVKLVFDIENVEVFSAKCASHGLKFGALHRANGYVFANAHDPCGNPISISSRAFRCNG
ncbi:VOC family protein [Mesorhizobium sp. ZC-5]|uniref:VOC family protein n=1 Tax=Mesorhizobium sp. ZC-5 TaxID=2986066 RepID=UPI0021E9841D|nr:VOC family protein [Mesorhizobium sp. ZC-5]MCV3240561.1 VOC family protein [Mesorhizobium sp. ZC-5]